MNQVSVKFTCPSGYGDNLILSAFIKEFYKYAGLPCAIDMFTSAPEVFTGHKFIRNVYGNEISPLMTDYDLEFVNNHVPYAALCRLPLAEQKYATLGNIVKKLASFAAQYKKYRDHAYLNAWAQLCRLKGLDLWSVVGASGAFPFSQQSKAFVPLSAEAHVILERLDLENARYLTLHAGMDARYCIANPPKVWPTENWVEFCRLFKARCPEIRLIQIGAPQFQPIAGVDLCLLGKTSMAESAIILKHALLHVDGESGLVHLRRQLGGKSVVLFGPTPAAYYGYPENINVVSEVCGNCLWLTNDWFKGCLKGHEKPLCLSSILPETVLGSVAACLEEKEKKSFSYTLERPVLYSSAVRKEYEPVFLDLCRDLGFEPKPISEHSFGKCGVYVHASKQWEYPYVLSVAQTLGAGLRIADVGAGRGALAWRLTRLGHKVTAYDLDFSHGAADAFLKDGDFIRFAAKQGFTAEYGSLFNLPAEDETFDLVVCVSVIEHVRHKYYALKELLRVLKPGGRLALTYDLTTEGSGLEDRNRMEIFTPQTLAETLEKFGVEARGIYDAEALRCSLAEVQADKVGGAPLGLTFGGLVLLKSPSTLRYGSAESISPVRCAGEEKPVPRAKPASMQIIVGEFDMEGAARSAFPSPLQRVCIATVKPVIKIIVRPESYIKLCLDPSDTFAGTGNVFVKLFGRFLGLLGPKPQKTGYKTRFIDRSQ